MKKTIFTLSPITVAILSITGTSQVLAQGGNNTRSKQSSQIEEIVVTARKRSETLQDVPFAIQALSEDQMKTRGAVDLESLSNNVAGFTVQNLGPGQSQVAIRGISAGQVVRDQPGVKEQVGVYLDESAISLSLFTPDLDFYDMNRVEVLRGPQGTLFGSGSLSGTVRYISNQPDPDEFEGSVEAGLNTIEEGGNGGEIKGMINVPLSDRAALRVVGYTTEYAGFIDAIQPGGNVKENVNDGNRYGIRAALMFQPTDTLTITPRIIYQELNIDGFNREDDFNILANEFTTTRTPVKLRDYEQFTQLNEKFEDEFLLADIKVDFDLAWATLTSITSWTERDILVLRDATALTGSITGGSYPTNPANAGFDFGEATYTLNAPLKDTTEVEMLTQELRLASGDDSTLSWVVGAFYSKIDRRYGQNLLVSGFEQATGGLETEGPLAGTDVLYFSDVPYDYEQWALFGELDYALSENLTLTVGARWYDFEEDRTLNFDGIFAEKGNINVKGNTASDGISPRVMLNYDYTDDVSFNAQVSKGFRLGGINDPLNVGSCTPADLATFSGSDTFDDEKLINYEIGSKMKLMDGTATLNVSVFHSDIDDLQATVDAGTCSSRVVFNVPEASSTGLEFEFFTNLTEQIELALTGSLINAELESDVTSTDANGNVSIVGGLESGNELPTVPKVQGAISGTYHMNLADNLDGALTLTYQYVGDRHTQTIDLDPDIGTVPLFTNIGDIPAANGTLVFDPELDDYNITNLRFTVTADQWTAAAYINNLTNERAELSLDRERGLRARIAHRVNPPRTFGVTVKRLF